MEKILATPKAKKYARDHHLSLEQIRGTGEYGSVCYQDVKNVRPKQRLTGVARKMAEYYQLDLNSISFVNPVITKNDVLKYVNLADVRPLSVKRRTIANNILQSINNSAQYTLFAEMDTTKFNSFFREQKEVFAKEKRKHLTYTDVLIAAVSKALMINKKMNASLLGDRLYVYNYVNISVAVAYEEGLMAPVIKGANLMFLEQICDARTDIVNRTQMQKLTPDDLNGGTFTISNLGNSQVTYFTPILNYPQSAILGVGKTEKKPVVRDDQIVIRDITYFSLTMDHLILDGKDGDNFLSTINRILRNPEQYIF